MHLNIPGYKSTSVNRQWCRLLFLHVMLSLRIVPFVFSQFLCFFVCFVSKWLALLDQTPPSAPATSTDKLEKEQPKDAWDFKKNKKNLSIMWDMSCACWYLNERPTVITCLCDASSLPWWRVSFWRGGRKVLIAGGVTLWLLCPLRRRWRLPSIISKQGVFSLLPIRCFDES